MGVAFEAIRCTLPSCRCDCFQPGKSHVRTCDTCKHGWVAHALDKLGFRSMYQMGVQVEVVQPSVVFDIASLMLYGSQATPIRLKILLDRLFSVLQHEEVLQVLHGFGWSYEDYARGYILQDPSGQVLDKWNLCTREEEQVILQQFLRFGETKAIAQDIILQDARENHNRHLLATPKNESDIKKFLERTPVAPSSSSSSPTAGSNAAVAALRNFETRYPIRPFPAGFGLIPNKLFSPAAAAAAMAAGFPIPTSVPSVTSAFQAKESPIKESPVKSSVNNATSSVATTTTVTNSGRGSPLSRLQTMQPFDYRREKVSPAAISPASSSEKSVPVTPSGCSSPQNLSVSSSAGSMTSPISASLNNHHISSKMDSKIAYSPSKSSMPMDLLYRDYSAPLDFSVKDHSGGSSSSHQHHYHNPLIDLPNRSGMSYHGAADDKSRNNNIRKVVPTIQRRNYSPTPGYGGTLVSPSGKKRVLCTACNKTFCDKGALKIHYSAVHLKEMHKCTVEGCNMMFSSRRSRNRHSANPNPKLHMPQNRRKLPDGAIVLDDKNPPPHLPTSLPELIHPLGPIPMTSSAINAVGALEIKPITVMPMPFPGMPHLTPVKHSYSDLEEGERRRFMTSPSKMPRFHDDEDDEEGLPKACSSPLPSRNYHNGDKMDIASAERTVSKRKSGVPTRCAQIDDTYEMSDDNSMDGIEVSEGEDPMLDCVKSQSSFDGAVSQDDVDDDDDDHMVIATHSAFHKVERSNHNHLNNGKDSQNTESRYRDESPQRRDFTHESRDFSHENKENKEEKVDRNIMTSTTRDRESERRYTLMNHPAMHPIVGLDGIYEEALDMSTSNHGTADKKDDSTGDKDTDKLGDAGLTNHDREGYMDEDTVEDSLNDDDFDESVEIPYDLDDPKKCPACGKMFQNHFTVKTHYQNVHLKLMHRCTVGGCNAAFPSKRSRDRHSSNLNLHRKLLSTSSIADGRIGHRSPIGGGGQSLREEFLARIYDPQHMSGAFAAVMQQEYNTMLAAGSNGLTALNRDESENRVVKADDTDCNEDNSMRISKEEELNLNTSCQSDDGEEQKHSNSFNTTGHSNSLINSHSNATVHSNSLMNSHHNNGHTSDSEHDRSTDEQQLNNDLSIDEDNNEKQIIGGKQPNNQDLSFEIPEDSPRPDPNGDAECHICTFRFRDNLVLKEHFEKVHPKEMYHCTIRGCDKIFSTRKSRNRHSQNENLHRHIPEATATMV